ncbi:MAG: 2Fe-2S iron-sulfur cluster binding domain-containing protein [Dehalococcoidia bacterium]|nr:2Fe-2S iron-sulfur cluster binding domain-containing protein [Dehalococcoidia bacterium]
MGQDSKTYTVTFQPASRKVTVTAHTSIFTAASIAGISIVNVCHGLGVCMQCRVKILKGNAPPDGDAILFLSPEELSNGYVLACHTPVTDDLEVFIPELHSP